MNVTVRTEVKLVSTDRVTLWTRWNW